MVTSMPFVSPTLLAPTTGKRVDLLIIAGEHSGDEQAARLVLELKARHPDLSIAALGGVKLAETGAHLVYDMTASAVVGFFEVVRHYPFFKILFGKVLDWINVYQPQAILFVDYPGFNLRLAKALKKAGLSQKGGGAIPLYYYIAPQVWAWKAARRFSMAESLDALGVIFPFEVDAFKDTTLPVSFVGHPFANESYQLPVAYDAAAPLLLLPGSRKAAVKRIFPLMLEGFQALLKKHPQAQATILYPSPVIQNILEHILGKYPLLKGHCKLLPREGGGPIGASAVLTSSGTMSLNCALAGIPGAIVYRAAPVTYWIGRLLVKVPYLGIANLLLNEAFYPEYIQGAAKAVTLSQELDDCLTNPQRLLATKAGAIRLKIALGAGSDISRSAASWLSTLMRLHA